MTRYLVRRLFEMVITVAFSSLLIFLILHLSPGGPFEQLAQSRGFNDPSYLDRLNEMIGLDKPIHERYLAWASNIVRGDWGRSWVVATGRPVLELVQGRLGNTLVLMGTALAVSLIIALLVGTISAIKQYSVLDSAATSFSFFGMSMPVFWFALMLILIFSLWLGWLPTSGMYSVGKQHDLLNRIQHLILPVTVLSLSQVAQWSRYTRSSLLEVLRQDYVRTARAKGLYERMVLGRHALRNALMPVITVLALDIPSLFAGAIITETIFAWPGMGRLYYDSVVGADWPVAMGLLLITAILVVMANLLADILYVVADPRIRYE